MQTVTIDLIPQKEKPIVKLSQYDNVRQVRFMLEENGETYTLAGTETVEVNIRKPDRNIVVIAPTIGANAYVDVFFTEQAAACFGESFGELSIKSGETVIGTCNFIIDVEISPTFGGIDSTTEINNLETQIEEIITEVLSDDYYTKAQTDTLLNAKANASDVYTKSQTDTLLSAKADASDVYTKTEVDNIILGIMPVDSVASSPIASFNTALAVDLVDVKTNLKPSLSGYSAVNLTACGVNLFDKSLLIDQVAWNIFTLKLAPNTTYTMSSNLPVSVTNELPCYVFPSSGNPSSSNLVYSGHSVSLTTLSDGIVKIQQRRVSGTDSFQNYNWQIENGNLASEYHAYNGHTYVIPFGQTVYGGTLDVTTGVLTVNKNTITFNGSEGWYEYARGTDTVVYALQNAVDSILNENDQFSNLFTYNARSFDVSLNTPNIFVLGTSKRLYVQVNISDYATVTAFQTALSNTNFEVNYNVTETTIDLGSGTAVTARAGVNNVYSDTGDTSVKFKDSIQHYIDTH